MQFQPGQSGNLAGRPPGTGTAQRLAKSHAADAVKTLVAIQADPTAAHETRVQAALGILSAIKQ